MGCIFHLGEDCALLEDGIQFKGETGKDQGR